MGISTALDNALLIGSRVVNDFMLKEDFFFVVNILRNNNCIVENNRSRETRFEKKKSI